MSRRLLNGLIPAALGALACMAGRADAAPMTTETFEFVADGNVLRGVIDLPAGRAPRAVLLFVHGYGRTDVVARNWYHDLRSRFTALGLATVVWDKPGCGGSEGTFDIGQPVQSSAREVVAAVRQVREKALPGATKIGLWGISRAGWIAPLAMAQDPGIRFWISVSGTDDKENVPGFRDLLGRLDMPVLALFGEQDRNVDWRKTRALYTERIGRNPKARLTVRTFPDGNHNLHQSRTGGYREMLEILNSPPVKMSEGYYEAILEWLRTQVLDARSVGS